MQTRTENVAASAEAAPPLYTLAEVQARWRISKGCLAKLVRAGDVASVRLGRRRFIPAAAVASREQGRAA